MTYKSIDLKEVCVIDLDNSMMGPIIDYLENEKLSYDPK